MALSDEFNTFGPGKSWQDKVLEADRIWAQVKAMLDEQQLKLPETPRRPDVRMIVNNISGVDVQFKNPGDHSGSKQELIPGTGDKTAAMIMVKGDTLEEQYNNAAILYRKYDLDLLGLSKNFIADLKAGKLSDLVAEAYGPAPFEQQAGKLVDVAWKQQNGTEDKIVPKKGRSAAYGARAATNEMVILAQFQVFVKGTGTTPELCEGYGMNIAVSSDWQTGAVSTRPIVPSVAVTYYGAHTFNIPAVIVHPDGMVKEIDLKNGTVIGLDASLTKTQVIKKSQAPKP